MAAGKRIIFSESRFYQLKCILKTVGKRQKKALLLTGKFKNPDQKIHKFEDFKNRLLMEPRFETLAEKKLIGNKLTMSLAADITSELWRNFMPRRKEIMNSIGPDLYSLQVYDSAYFAAFNPESNFEKWAAVEVSDFNQVPEGMEALILPGGLYAVFLHRGASTDTSTYQYIFTNWLPNSNYELDNRPHFEFLGAKYKNNDPDSEEEIWVPVRVKE